MGGYDEKTTPPSSCTSPLVLCFGVDRFVMLKIISLFLIFMAVLAMFGKLRLPKFKSRKPRFPPDPLKRDPLKRDPRDEDKPE
jgi:hypothetical protein